MKKVIILLSLLFIVYHTPTLSFAECTWVILSPTSNPHGRVRGGSGYVDVNTSPYCSWTASSNVSWIAITSGSSGYNNGRVNYSYAANDTSAARTGTLRIAGETFTLIQQDYCRVEDNCSHMVTVTAPTTTAKETGQVPGKFRIERTGATTSTLDVGLTMSGTATNGTDYTNIPSTVTIPTGQSYVEITLMPLDDSIYEGNETVIMTAASDYYVAGNNSAMITIEDNDKPPDVPQSGQTTCYDASGTAITCAGTGQDGDIRAGVAWPNPRFTDNGDQTVTDNLTGLIWTKDANLVRYGTLNWQNALDYIASLNEANYLGHNDWRLPNVVELESMVNADLSRDTYTWLNSNGFINAYGGYYWSSSTPADRTNCAMIVSLYVGNVAVLAKSHDAHVWPVRSGQSGALGSSVFSLPKTGQTTCYNASGSTVACAGTGQDGDLRAGVDWPNPRFTDNGDQTVTDNLTRLNWTKDAKTPGPSACSPGRSMTWSDALDYVKCLNTNNYRGHNDWRLPNRKELRSLINNDQVDSAAWLNSQGFINVYSGIYLSSTNASYDDYMNVWIVRMKDGEIEFGNKVNAYKNRTYYYASLSYVWPVRSWNSGQSGPFNKLDISKAGAGTGTITSIPTGITCGSNCSGYFTVGSSVTLTATPDAGLWTFAGWSGACSGTQITCQLTMDSDKAVTATFTPPDTTGPTGTVTINGGAAYTNNPTVTLTLSASDPSGVSQMQFSNDNVTWSDPEPYGTTKSWTLLLGEGFKTVYVKVKDSAGNWSAPFYATIYLDTTAPVTTIAGKPAAITNASTASFTFSANEASTFQCQIDSGGFSACASPQTYTGLTEGSHTFTVKATDTAGNTETLPPSYTWTVDITKPVVGVSYSGGFYTNAGAITLILSGTDTSGLAGMMFSWDGGASWGAEETYGTTKTWNLGSSDGLKTVYVKFKDTAGNWSDPYRYDLTLDTMPPTLNVGTHGSCTNNPAITISGSATDTLSGLKNVTVNGTAVTVQSGSFSQGLTLTNGANTIVIAARDNADNVTTVNQEITLDQTAPVLTVSAPAEMGDIDLSTGAAMIDVKGTVNESATVTIRVNSDTPVFVSVLDNAFAFPITLETGTNVIEVTAVDCAGNTSTLQRTVVYDKDKPTLSVTAPAADMATNQSGLTIRGSVSDQTAITLTIKVNSDSYPVTINNGIFEKTVTFSEEKTYQIEVTAIDASGNTSTITRNVVYDKTQPVFTVNLVTSPTNQNSQTLYGTREAKAIITATCNTAATVGAVSYPTETSWSIALTNLVDGANTITLTAIDAAGNKTVTTTSIFLDRTIESAVISGTPNSPTKTTSATLNIGGSGITAYKYKLDTSAYSAETPVATPITLNSLTEGTHTLFVIGKDTAGNWQSEANATTTTWVVDLTPPIITATPAGNVYQTPQTVLLTASEAATIYYTVDNNEPTITSQVYGGLIPIRETTNLKFFARDGAGNMGSTRTETYTLSIPLTVVMSGWGGGAVTVDGTSLSWNERTASAIYNRVTDVTLRAIPDGNSSFASWSGACSGNSLTCTVAMDQARTVTATFADITVPTGSAYYTGGIYATGSTVTLNLSASDVTGISAVRFSSDGTVWGSEQVFAQTWIWNLGSGDGQKKVYVQFRDNAGIWSQSYSYTLTLDTTAPVLNLSTLSDGAYTDNSMLNISGTINDVTSGVKTLTINGTSVTVQGGSFSHTITLESGSNVITTVATDNAGNSVTDTRTIVYDIAPILKGDINGNSIVDLADAVMALQIVSRFTPAQPIYKNADVGGDAKIGLQEVIYILQKVAEMR